MKAKLFLAITLLFMSFTAHARQHETEKQVFPQVLEAFNLILKCQAAIKIVVYYTDIYQVYRTDLEKNGLSEQAVVMKEKLLENWFGFEAIAINLKSWLVSNGFSAEKFERDVYRRHQRDILEQIIQNTPTKKLVFETLKTINLCESKIGELASVLDAKENN